MKIHEFQKKIQRPSLEGAMGACQSCGEWFQTLQLFQARLFFFETMDQDDSSHGGMVVYRLYLQDPTCSYRNIHLKKFGFQAALSWLGPLERQPCWTLLLVLSKRCTGCMVKLWGSNRNWNTHLEFFFVWAPEKWILTDIASIDIQPIYKNYYNFNTFFVYPTGFRNPPPTCSQELQKSTDLSPDVTELRRGSRILMWNTHGESLEMIYIRGG